MSQPQDAPTPAGMEFDLELSCDSQIESADGNHARSLGPTRRPGPFRIAVECDGEVHHLRVSELISQKAFALRAKANDLVLGPEESMLTWLPAAKRAEALLWESHVLDIVIGRSGSPDGRPGPYDTETTTETQRRKNKAAETGVSQSTLTRRIQDYYGAGGHVGPLGLVKNLRRALQAAGAIDVDPAILAVVQDFAARRTHSSKKTLLNEYGMVVEDLRHAGLVSLHENAGLDGGPRVPLAEEALPYTKFVALLRSLNGGRDPRSAKTRQSQDNRPPVNDYRHRAFDFADRVEMDSTPIDVFVRGPKGPVKAHLVIAICVSTRYPWPRVTLGSPRGRDMALVLWDMTGGEAAFRPDSDLASESIPNLPRHALWINAWRGLGKMPIAIPGCVVLDHGPEEENNRLIRYCAQLAASVSWGRTRHPTDKAYIESSISEFARACQLVPGHKGNTVENRPGIDPTELPTIEMLQAAVAEWQQFYVNQPHSGLPLLHSPGHFLTPLEAVANSMTRGIPVRGMLDPTRALGLLEHTKQRPQDDGIVFGPHRQRYTCPGYQSILNASVGRDGKRRKTTFYYDPARPGRLYWPIPGSAEVLTLMTPQEAGRATVPFADVREEWLAAAQGHKRPGPTEKGVQRSRLVRAIRDVFAGDPDNAQSAPTRNKSGRPSGRSTATSPGDLDKSDLMTDGWDLSADMDAIYEPHSGADDPATRPPAIDRRR